MKAIKYKRRQTHDCTFIAKTETKQIERERDAERNPKMYKMNRNGERKERKNRRRL